MLLYADLETPLWWTFEHDSHPKHCYRIVKSWLDNKTLNVMSLIAQSPELNPTENVLMSVPDKFRAKFLNMARIL